MNEALKKMREDGALRDENEALRKKLAACWEKWEVVDELAANWEEMRAGFEEKWKKTWNAEFVEWVRARSKWQKKEDEWMKKEVDWEKEKKQMVEKLKKCSVLLQHGHAAPEAMRIRGCSRSSDVLKDEDSWLL